LLLAEGASDVATRSELLVMARAWQSLADQAERNSKSDLYYETPSQVPSVSQQQQQIQQSNKDEA